MLKHLVFFRLKDHALNASKAENVHSLAKRLHSLQGQIPELQYIEVGLNVIQSETASDLALTTIFEDEAALSRYAVHPAHLEVVAFIKEVVSERRAVDYHTLT